MSSQATELCRPFAAEVARIHRHRSSHPRNLSRRQSTIFAVIDSVLLRPLPFPDSGRLVTIFNTYPKAGVERDGSSVTNYYERRGHIPAFASLAIYRYGSAIIGESGSTERERIMLVTPDFFATLGVAPVMGRVFTEDETSYQADDVVILSDAYWRQRYQADPHIVGTQIRADGVTTTVIGVLPPGFRFLSSEARLYFPLASRSADRAPAQRHSGGNVIQMVARLKPDATLLQAQSQLDAQNAALEVDDPQAKMIADAGFRSLVVPLQADHVAAIRPDSAVVTSGRARPLADRCRQPGQPSLGPREWPREGVGGSAGAGCQPAAHCHRNDCRDHDAHCRRGSLGSRRRCRRDSPAARVRRRSPAFGESHRVRRAFGVGSPDRRHPPRRHARDTDCLVQPSPSTG